MAVTEISKFRMKKKTFLIGCASFDEIIQLYTFILSCKVKNNFDKVFTILCNLCIVEALNSPKIFFVVDFIYGLLFCNFFALEKIFAYRGILPE